MPRDRQKRPRDADSIIDDVKRRLAALAEDPPFRFRHTSRADALAYMKRFSTFEGCADAEIASVEAALGLRFTDVFRAYLRHMGKVGGRLLEGSDLIPLKQFARYRKWGQAFMHRTNPSLVLPADAVVLLTHQGYEFVFLQQNGKFDAPVYLFVEEDLAPSQLTRSFAQYLNAEVSLMEENDHSFRASGGYFVTVGKGHRGGSMQFPARSRRPRPTEEPFKLPD